MSKEKIDKFLKYKGKPLVRCENMMFYGDMSEKYIVMFQILSSQTVNGEEVPKNILIQLQTTDPAVKGKDVVIKKTEKTGLYNALEIGSIWLERALSEE